MRVRLRARIDPLSALSEIQQERRDKRVRQQMPGRFAEMNVNCGSECKCAKKQRKTRNNQRLEMRTARRREVLLAQEQCAPGRPGPQCCAR